MPSQWAGYPCETSLPAAGNVIARDLAAFRCWKYTENGKLVQYDWNDIKQNCPCSNGYPVMLVPRSDKAEATGAIHVHRPICQDREVPWRLRPEISKSVNLLEVLISIQCFKAVSSCQ